MGVLSLITQYSPLCSADTIRRQDALRLALKRLMNPRTVALAFPNISTSRRLFRFRTTSFHRGGLGTIVELVVLLAKYDPSAEEAARLSV